MIDAWTGDGGKSVGLALVVLLAAGAVPLAGADPGSGPDAADEPATAQTLAPGTYTAELDPVSDEDWYRLIAPVLTKVTITVEPDCSKQVVDTDLELYQGDGSTLITADTNGNCLSTSVDCWTNANQQLFTRVYTSSNNNGTYELTHTQTAYDATSTGTLPTPTCTL